jgi:hypothetical protein
VRSRGGSSWRRRLPLSVPAALGAAALALAARADPWIPAAGDGRIEPMVRFFDATQAFSPSGFGTATQPSSEVRYSMYRITGTQGIGGRLSIEYDLRAANLEKIRYKRGSRLIESASGPEDQEIGLNLGLHQRRGFADSIELNVIAPTGRVSGSPQLGTGHAALEPDYQLGIARGRFLATVTTGARVFVDGAAAQLRTDVDVGFHVTRNIELAGTLFFVRTLVRNSPLPAADAGERYDLLRPGVRIRYRVSRLFRPYLEYEDDVAGKAIHAGRRITVGFTVDY